MSVKLPLLLDKGSFKPTRMLHPVHMSFQRELIPCSSARMVLPEGEQIAIRDFVRLYTINGDEGIFRVTAVAPAIPGGTDVVLSHGLCVLYDARMTGTGTLEGSLGDVVRQLLSHQVVFMGGTPLFAAGNFASGATIRVEYNNSRVLDLLEEACEKAYTEKLTIDQSSIPWVVGSVALSNATAAEGRFSRNLQSVKINMDDDDQCTRLIVEHTDWDTDEKTYTTHDADTIGQYGIIEDVWPVPYGATQDEESAYIAELFRQRKEPDTSIEIDAVDLFAGTGESLDKLDTGDLMRCCLPDYDTTINNRLMTVHYPDVFDDPHAAVVSLRNRHRRLSDMLRNVQRETKANSRRYGGMSSQVEKTNIRLEATYHEVEELDTTTKETFNRVFLDLDAKKAAIELNASSIVQVGEQVSYAQAQLIVQAGQISSKVEKNGVISAINQTAETVLISADRINLIGSTFISDLAADVARIESFFSDVSGASVLNVGMVNCTNNMIFQDEVVGWNSKSVVTGVNITQEKNIIKVMSENGTVVTINYVENVTATPARSTMDYLGR